MQSPGSCSPLLVDFAPRAPTSSPARVRAIVDEFPKAFLSLEFATGILNFGVGRMIDWEVPKWISRSPAPATSPEAAPSQPGGSPGQSHIAPWPAAESRHNVHRAVPPAHLPHLRQLN
jgi:hypothetical protein